MKNYLDIIHDLLHVRSLGFFAVQYEENNSVFTLLFGFFFSNAGLSKQLRISS